ncbi:hypothetical protein KY319_01220 [Candidatus Woesearchaeota archaeon]|nr:hypothetical protein [Candidatus Woesearchaeota archaeon]
MREKLTSAIKRLCWLFPQLKPNIKYSEVLTQEEIDVYTAFVNGHIQEIIKEHKRKQLDIYLKGSTGIPKIHKEDVKYIASLLTAATSNENNKKTEDYELVNFLRENRKIWWKLYNTYDKIIKNRLIGTCPIATAKIPFIEKILPFGTKLHRFQEYNKLLHESIHCLLEENGICFHNKQLDEGLVVCLHRKITGKTKCQFHYTGEEAEKYLSQADKFEKIMNKIPTSAFIPLIRKLETKAQ